MNKTIKLGAFIAPLFLLVANEIHAQDDVLILDDNVQFDDGAIFNDDSFNFDDDLFGDAFDEESADDESWLDNFTIKVSQQIFGQVNNHSTELLPGFSIPQEDELSNNRLGINIRYQNPFAPGWLLQASAQAKAYWAADYEYETNDDRVDTEYRLNELFLQRSFGQHSVKFGRQTVVWGETVGNSVLDVINTSEFRDFTIIDIEDARLNQLMVVWDFFGEDSNFSTFVNLYPEFNPPAVRGSPFFFEPAFNLTDYDRDSELLIEVGTQWRKSFEGSDIAFMAAYLYENQLRYEDPISGFGDAVGEKNDFLLLGFSANRAIGKLLLNFDLAYSHNVLADSFNFPGTTALTSAINLRKDQIGTSFGFEYAVSNEQSVSVGVQAQMVLDEDEGLLPGQSLFNEGVVGSWLMRYSNSLMNGDLVLSSTMQGDLKADSLLVLLGADFTINDNWAVSGQLISINAASDSPLLLFDANVHLGATITYSF
ncbi:MAG: hypothetical protein HOF74_08305 [Gammaproteobacteria bacterium]|jgi:hypothetical protein|nr:hypothetical protein [Gammaproteobacteria bacterium]MBT3859816.1 hypothetical protein [Gammaproteobacteria bacterium]MBT3988854.1 hypothetical protein [Gammaproteobacteria bacterium]MBT4254925.1 hypothetical protein [Gammaproteobacteria bacterium]MBT4580888.1 hypothetical protein [Gammaproteobacteria bacterium]